MAASESSPTGAKLEPPTSISKIGPPPPGPEEEQAEEAAARAAEDDETGSVDGGGDEGSPPVVTSRTLHATIWLVVSVPVLSEQMTVVQPRVSTAGRDLTMAFFLAWFFE